MKMPFYHQQLKKAKKSNPVPPQIIEVIVGRFFQTLLKPTLKFY